VISIRRWQARHLFLSWTAYWFGLLAFVAWRPLVEYWRITRSPSGHGSVGFTYSGGALQAALWIAGPPLVIFLAWLATRSRGVERAPVRER
jgi:hypothetical protein